MYTYKNRVANIYMYVTVYWHTDFCTYIHTYICNSSRPRHSSSIQRFHLQDVSQSLVSTAWYYISRLSEQDYTSLKETCAYLNNRTIRVGTTCSGLESVVPILKLTAAVLNKHFNVRLSFRFMFACDRAELRQMYIKDRLCISAYIHTYIHTYAHTYVRMYVHT